MAESCGKSLSGWSESCRTFERKDKVRFDKSSPREPYLSFTIGPLPLRRLVIRIWSRDQDRCDDQDETENFYMDSHTSFALGIVQRSSPDEQYLCEVRRNVRASTEIKYHILEWELNIPFEGDQSDENEAQGWLDSISSGPGLMVGVEVGLFPLARNFDWANVVYQVAVELYDDMNTDLMLATTPRSRNIMSQILEMEGAATASTFLSREMKGAQGVLTQTPDRDPTIAAISYNLAIGVAERYMYTRSIEDLTCVIEITQKAIEAMPNNHPNHAMSLSNLGAWLSRRYDATKSTEDLTRAIEVAQEAITLIPDNHPNLASFLYNLGLWLQRQYDRTQSIEDVSELIRVWEQVIEATPAGHPDLVVRFKNLAFALDRRFKHTRSIEDLTRAIEINQKAVEGISDDHPELGPILESLGNSLGSRYDEAGRLEDLGSAIEVFERVVNTVSRRNRNFHWYLCHLGIWLRARFEATGSMKDLDRATEVTQSAVELTPAGDHGALAMSLSHLGVCLGIRSEQRRSADDLDMAIHLSEQAIAVIPDNHPDLGFACNNLGKWLIRKSGRDSLTRAIQVTEKAIEAIGYDHIHSAPCLGSLSHALSQRFAVTGSVDDLSRAMDAAQKSVRATPNDHPNFPTHFSALGNSLNARHTLIGSEDDLTRAIEAAEKVVDATPPDHLTFAGKLHNLSVQLSNRHSRTGSMNDLTRGIEISQQAVERSNVGNLCRCLRNLGAMLRKRNRETGAMEDLERAIEVDQKALEAAQDENEISDCLVDLGRAIGERYERTGSLSDLTRAIEVTEKGVNGKDQGDIDLTSYLRDLGNMLGARYAKTREKPDQDAQLSAYTRAWRCATSFPSSRIESAKLAADIHASRLEWDRSYGMSRKALLLLPKVSQRSLKQRDMQKLLSPTSGLATDTAATAMNAGKDASEVLSILELGRGVIAGLLIDSRGDLSGLRETHPSLADRFDVLRKELNSPSQDSGSIAELSIANRRQQASYELDEVIAQIRLQDGFHDFLQPPPAESLMAAAESGSIVLINVSRYRCDAILVKRHTVSLLELPGLNIEDVEEHVKNISVSKHQPWHLLEWLWTTVCRPCLDALGFTKPISDGQWPHIWWVPTGPLSQLPLHAAGIYTPGSKDTVLDRVVSSYASSIKALQHGRQRRGGRVDEHVNQNDAILVAMEQTKGQMSLPNARTEIDKVKALCPLLHVNATTPPRRRNDILGHMKNCKILHFAGHGVSKTDPSQSCLILDDWETNPLTVADLRESWLQESPAFLAYLSACSTGSNQGKGLADEAIHLVSAFQVAGFRHVIGTLWEVSDPHCVDVATVLYQTLCDEGMTDEAVSHGLHHAVRKLRDDSFREGNKRDIVLVGEDDEPTPRSGVNTFWIPYIHYGA